jgi:hypothetical protein
VAAVWASSRSSSATSCDSPAPPDAVSPGHNGERFVGRCQDTDGGLAVAQLCGDAVTVRLVQAEPLVVKCAEDAAANDPCRAIAIDFGRPSFPPRAGWRPYVQVAS